MKKLLFTVLFLAAAAAGYAAAQLTMQIKMESVKHHMEPQEISQSAEIMLSTIQKTNLPGRIVQEN